MSELLVNTRASCMPRFCSVRKAICILAACPFSPDPGPSHTLHCTHSSHSQFLRCRPSPQQRQLSAQLLVWPLPKIEGMADMQE